MKTYTDKQRLDWISKSKAFMPTYRVNSSKWWAWTNFGLASKAVYAKTLRQAIDKAMRLEGVKP